MSMLHYPIQERPRERLLSHGAQHLSDAELLAICLRTGTKGQNAIEMARALLSHFGSLYHLLHADYASIASFLGIGTAKYTQIASILEISKRYFLCRMQEKTAIQGVDDMKKYLIMEMQHAHQEVFGCVFLDAQQKIIRFEKLFYGNLDQTVLHPRQVIRSALQAHAAFLIAVHNHPSGNPQPSFTDRETTQILKQAMHWIDVDLLDHIVVGGNCAISLKEIGWM